MGECDSMLPSSMWKIEPLTNDNWLGWKQRVWALLEERELDGYVDGSMAQPTESGTMQNTWDKKERAAMRCIKLIIGNANMGHILRAATSKQMWDQIA